MKRGFVRICQRLVLLTAVVISSWFVVYPAPAFYTWIDGSGWQKDGYYARPGNRYPRRTETVTPAQRAALKRILSRRLIVDYEPYGTVRADYRSMVVDLGFTWTIAFGLVLVVKPAGK